MSNRPLPPERVFFVFRNGTFVLVSNKKGEGYRWDLPRGMLPAAAHGQVELLLKQDFVEVTVLSVEELMLPEFSEPGSPFADCIAYACAIDKKSRGKMEGIFGVSRKNLAHLPLSLTPAAEAAIRLDYVQSRLS